MSTDFPLRQIVSDTSPIISFEKITGGYRFIQRLYDRLIVPPAVIGDEDLLVLDPFQSVRIVRPGAFVETFPPVGEGAAL